MATLSHKIRQDDTLRNRRRITTRSLLAAFLLLVLLTTTLCRSEAYENKKPQPKPGSPNTFTLQLCEDEVYVTPGMGKTQAIIKHVKSSNTHTAYAGEHGTNTIKISATHSGRTNVTYDISLDNGRTVTTITIEVTVVKCGRKIPEQPKIPIKNGGDRTPTGVGNNNEAVRRRVGGFYLDPR